MFGKGKIGEMIKSFQDQFEGMQEGFAKITVIGESGAGLVKTHMNGKRDVLKIEIDPSVLTEDKAVIEDLVAASVNDAIQKIERAQQEQMSSIAKKFDLPK